MTPRESIRAECARRGRGAVVAGCVELLEGVGVDEDLIYALAGPAGAVVLAAGPGDATSYWLRVWAVRGLLHVWDERAASAINAASSDESWRVREKVAQIVAAHRVEAAFDAVVALSADPVPRVRVAAERALRNLAAAT